MVVKNNNEIISVFNMFRRQHDEYMRRTLDYSEDSTQPASANSSVSEGPVSPLVLEANPHAGLETDANHSQEVESLKRLLQEVRAKLCVCGLWCF